MSREIELPSHRYGKRVLRLALFASIASSMSGCGIPQLRSPVPGAAMPSSFQAVTNWNQNQTVVNDNHLGMPTNDAPVVNAKSSPTTAEELQKSADPANQDAKDQENSTDSGSSDEKDKSSDKSTRRRWYNPAVKLVNFVKPSPAIQIDDQQAEKTPDAQNPATTTTESASNAAQVDAAKVDAANADAAANDATKAVDDQALNVVLLSGGGWQADPVGTPSSGVIGRFEMFHDPVLIGLIEQAIVGNQELKILAEEVQIACYEVQARSGAYLPFVDYNARIGAEKSGRLTREGAVEEQLEGRPGRAFPDPVPDFMVGTTVSWEIDIWKRLRNSQRAAAMRYLGTREGRNYVVTRLVAEIAESYYELMALDNRLIALNQMIEIQQKSLEIAQAKKAAARETELAVQRFQAELRKNESQRLIVQQQIIEVENAINSLLGRYPQPIPRSSVDFVSMQLNSLRMGLPPELLRNRADIRQAERDVQAAGLDIQVAKARFYPSLGISAGVGYRAFDARYLFSTPDSLIYSVAGDLVGPLINKRAIQAEYRTANARQLQSVYNYQQTVIDAFTEVVNFLTRVENYGQSIEVKKQQLDSLVKSVDVATQLFQNARAEYMEVLLAQRDLMEVRMTLIETRQQQLGALVNAYRSLGGGGF